MLLEGREQLKKDTLQELLSLFKNGRKFTREELHWTGNRIWIDYANADQEEKVLMKKIGAKIIELDSSCKNMLDTAFAPKRWIKIIS